MPATEEILERLRTIVGRAEEEERDLTEEEVTEYEQTEEELRSAQRSREVRERQAAYETPVNDVPRVAGPDGPVNRNPLAYTPAALNQLADAVGRRASARIDAASIENVALTTGTLGQPAEWGANLLTGPRMLHTVAGVPRQGIDAVLAEFPQLTLPAVQSVVGEGGSLTEYDDSSADPAAGAGAADPAEQPGPA